MRSGGLNRTQRVVIAIGFGLGLYAFGEWVTTRGGGAPFGWVAYAPLSQANPLDTVRGLHPWVRLVIWLALIVVWVVVSVWLLRAPTESGGDKPAD